MVRRRHSATKIRLNFWDRFLCLLYLSLYSTIVFSVNPEVNCKLSSNNPWLRQQVLLVCELYTERSFMELEHNQLKLPWALSYKIPLQQSGRIQNGKQVYFHRFGWVLLPTKSGSQSLRVPRLKLDFGKYHIRLPEYKFIVKPLPVYLNPDSVVGYIKLRLLKRSQFWLQHQSLYPFRLEVRARGVPRQWIPPLETWLRSRPHVRYYVQRSRTTTFIDPKGLVTKITVDAGFVPTGVGLHKILNTAVKYFDPELSQWINQRYSRGSWFSVPAWIYWSCITLFLAVMTYILWKTGVYLNGFLRLWIKQRAIRKKVKGSQEYAELRELLHELLWNYGLARLPECQLYKIWSNVYGQNMVLKQLLDLDISQQFNVNELTPEIKLAEYKKNLLSMLGLIPLLTCYHKNSP